MGQPTRAGDYVTAARYYPNGQLTSFTYGNGLTFNQTLDNQQRPEYQTVKRSSAAVLQHLYQYDNNHNIDSILDLVEPAKNITLTYDGLDRLDTASGLWGSGSFSYDTVGNLETKVLGSQSLTYNYNANNRLSGITGSLSRSFAYDSRGNVTSNGTRTFSFNLGNQLITSGSNSYQYDGYNRRVKKTSSGKTQYSLYNAAGQLIMTDGDNGLTEYFYLGAKLVARENAVPTSEDTPGYTGHLEDDDLQLTYMQARYYDPVIGRFYSNDPVGFNGNNPMTFNRYAYANNNPYKYTDPDGRTAIPFPLTPMDTGVGPTGMQNLTSEQQAAGVGALIDATPVVGDIKAIGEAISNPTVANIAAAAVGVVPVVGDAAAAGIKASVTIGKNANQVSHAFRHTDKAGLARDKVTDAVTGAVSEAGDKLTPGLNKMSADVGGVKVDFNAYKHEDGSINIGRITPPKE